MANVIKHKRGSGSDPVASDLVVGEVAIRTDVGKLFTKMDNGSVAEIAGGGSDIAINTLSSSSATGGGSATFNGSAYRFTLSSPPSVSAQQLLVSINGVIQKPVAGTGQPSEGFSVDGTDIILGDAPATGADFFILTFKSLGVSEPADNSVTSAKIVDGAIVNADINASAAIAVSKLANFVNNNADNRVITGSGTANTLNGEANLTYDGTTLLANKASGVGYIASKGGTSAGDYAIVQVQNGTTVRGRLVGDAAVDAFRIDTAGGASTPIRFLTGSSYTERLRIDSSGNVGIGTSSPGTLLHLSSSDPRIKLTDTDGPLDTSIINSSGDLVLDTPSVHRDLIITSVGQSNEIARFTGDGKVGIGTSAPSSIVDISATSGDTILELNRSNSNTTGSVGIINFTASDGHSVGSIGMRGDGDNEGGDIVFRTTSAAANADPFNAATPERLRIDSSGRLLYGLTSSSRETSLILQGNSNSYTTNPGVLELRVGQVPSAQSALGSIAFGCTGDKIGGTINAIADNADWSSGSSHPTALRFFTCPVSSTSQFERMRIQSDGMIGIGTTGPKAGLHVAAENATYGKSAVFGANGFIDNANYHYTDATITLLGQDADGNNKGAGIEFTTRNTANNNWHHAAINMLRDGDFVFLNGGAGTSVGTEKMRLNTSGDLLVATTSSNVNSSNFGIVLGSDGSGGMFKNIGGSGDVFRTGGTQGLLQVNGDGDAFNTNNSYGQLSDETLKQDIVDAASQWDDIKNLKVRKFRFKDNPTGVLQIGVIAQETEKVSAGLVQEDDKGIKSVKYSVLYMKAVKCLQEAIAKIEVLETKVAALEAK